MTPTPPTPTDPAQPGTSPLAPSVAEFRAEIEYIVQDYSAVSAGDVWNTTWADDGHLYSVADDALGWFDDPRRFSGNKDFRDYSNIILCRIAGEAIDRLQGTNVNLFPEYGVCGTNIWWKSNGLICIDGVLYANIYKQGQGSYRGAKEKSVPGADGSVILSEDHGRTWVRSAEENALRPMFPGQLFSHFNFIQYGKNHAWACDGAERYVYAISSNGVWNNGDFAILGRVRRATLRNLEASDWQFYTGGDGLDDSRWATWDAYRRRPEIAFKIVADPHQVGMCSTQYVRPLGLYLMLNWYYEGPRPDNAQGHLGGPSIQQYLIASRPWGPYREIHRSEVDPRGFYNGCLLPKFMSGDGLTLPFVMAGNYTGSYRHPSDDPARHLPTPPLYSFLIHRLHLERTR